MSLEWIRGETSGEQSVEKRGEHRQDKEQSGEKAQEFFNRLLGLSSWSMLSCRSNPTRIVSPIFIGISYLTYWCLPVPC